MESVIQQPAYLVSRVAARLGTVCALSVALSIPSIATADTLVLQNGDRLTGEVAEFKQGGLRFKTGYAGELKISSDRIVSLGTDGPVTIKYKAGGYTTGRLVASPRETVTVERAGGTVTRPIRLGEIERIYPGTEVRTGLEWSGAVNLGLTERSGNTKSRDWHADGIITGEGEEDRVTFEGEFNREITEGDTTADDFMLAAQHDHFVSKRTYFYTNAQIEQDEPQNLNLRTTVGTGGGYELIKTDRTKLSVEAGPAYIHEDLIQGEDHGYFAGRWAVNFEYAVWEFAKFFHKHEGRTEFEDAGNTVIDSSTGFRFPFSDGFMLTAKADLDWDSQPPPGATSLDKTYLLTVGYTW